MRERHLQIRGEPYLPGPRRAGTGFLEQAAGALPLPLRLPQGDLP